MSLEFLATIFGFGSFLVGIYFGYIRFTQLSYAYKVNNKFASDLIFHRSNNTWEDYLEEVASGSLKLWKQIEFHYYQIILVLSLIFLFGLILFMTNTPVPAISLINIYLRWFLCILLAISYISLFTTLPILISDVISLSVGYDKAKNIQKEIIKRLPKKNFNKTDKIEMYVLQMIKDYGNG